MPPIQPPRETTDPEYLAYLEEQRREAARRALEQYDGPPTQAPPAPPPPVVDAQVDSVPAVPFTPNGGVAESDTVVADRTPPASLYRPTPPTARAAAPVTPAMAANAQSLGANTEADAPAEPAPEMPAWADIADPATGRPIDFSRPMSPRDVLVAANAAHATGVGMVNDMVVRPLLEAATAPDRRTGLLNESTTNLQNYLRDLDAAGIDPSTDTTALEMATAYTELVRNTGLLTPRQLREADELRSGTEGQTDAGGRILTEAGAIIALTALTGPAAAEGVAGRTAAALTGGVEAAAGQAALEGLGTAGSLAVRSAAAAARRVAAGHILPHAPAVPEEVSTFLSNAVRENQGATYSTRYGNLEGASEPTWAVAMFGGSRQQIAESADAVTPEAVARYMAAHSDELANPRNALSLEGGNAEVVRLFKDRGEALTAGRAFGHDAVFDLSSGAEAHFGDAVLERANNITQDLLSKGAKPFELPAGREGRGWIGAGKGWVMPDGTTFKTPGFTSHDEWAEAILGAGHEGYSFSPADAKQEMLHAGGVRLFVGDGTITVESKLPLTEEAIAAVNKARGERPSVLWDLPNGKHGQGSFEDFARAAGHDIQDVHLHNGTPVLTLNGASRPADDFGDAAAMMGMSKRDFLDVVAAPRPLMTQDLSQTMVNGARNWAGAPLAAGATAQQSDEDDPNKGLKIGLAAVAGGAFGIGAVASPQRVAGVLRNTNALRYVNMLSQTTTHLGNMIGNTVQVGREAVKLPLGIALDQLGPGTRHVSEISAGYQGLGGGLVTGLRSLPDYWRHNEIHNELLPTALANKFGAGTEGLAPGIKQVSEVVSKSLISADIVARSALAGLHQGAAAMRAAERNVGFGGMSEASVQERFQWVQQHPGMFTHVFDEANAAAQRGVYANDNWISRTMNFMVGDKRTPLIEALAEQGGWSEATKKWALAHPNLVKDLPANVPTDLRTEAVRFALQTAEPFARAPVNIMLQGLELASANVVRIGRAALGHGTPHDMTRWDAVAQEAADGVIGAALLATGAILGTRQGMTPPDPQSAPERNVLPENHQENALTLGNLNVSPLFLGAAGLPLVLGSILANDLPPALQEPDKFMKMAQDVGRTLRDASGMYGGLEYLKFLTGDASATEGLSEAAARQAVPGLLTAVQNFRGLAPREVHGVLDQIESQIPGAADTLPPQHAVTGEERQPRNPGAGAFLNFSHATTPQDHPIMAEARRLNVGIPQVQRVLNESAVPGEAEGAKTKLEPAEIETLAKLRTETRDSLTGMVASDYYQGLPAAQQAKAFKDVVNQYDAEHEMIVRPASTRNFPGRPKDWTPEYLMDKADADVTPQDVGIAKEAHEYIDRYFARGSVGREPTAEQWDWYTSSFRNPLYIMQEQERKLAEGEAIQAVPPEGVPRP